MKKLLYWLLAILVVILGVEFVLLYFPEVVNLNKGAKFGDVRITVASEQPAFVLKIKDKQALCDYGKEKGIINDISVSGAVDLVDGSIVNFPETINITLKNEPQSIWKSFVTDENGEQREARSYGSSYNVSTKTYTLDVYIPVSELVTIDGITTKNSISSAYIVSGLVLMSDKWLLSPEQITLRFNEIEQEIIGNKLEFFEVIQKTRV